MKQIPLAPYQHQLIRTVGAIFLCLCIALAPDVYANADKYKISYQRVLDDQRIEKAFNEGLHWQDNRFDTARIKIKVYNGYVLIYGEVPEPDLITKAEQHAQKLDNVRKVFNQLTVGTAHKPDTIDDLLLSVNIKARLLTSISTDASRVRYEVDGSTVYLMGLLNVEEARQTVQLVSNIDSVQKIVTLFEYVE